MFHQCESLWHHWPSSQKLNDCQNSHHDIIRQCQREVCVHKMTHSRKIGAGGESCSYSLIVLGFNVNLMALNLISYHFMGTKLHYSLISSLLALHLCQTKASL